jgi:hypothetical protein
MSGRRSGGFVETGATIEGLRPYLIHDERYIVVYFTKHDDPETIHQAQLSADALPDGIRVGDEVIVTWVLNIVAGIRRAAPAD